MFNLIIICLFVVLLAVPGFYIITRKIFPKNSKKSAYILSIVLTVALLALLLLSTYMGKS